MYACKSGLISISKRNCYQRTSPHTTGGVNWRVCILAPPTSHHQQQQADSNRSNTYIQILWHTHGWATSDAAHTNMAKDEHLHHTRHTPTLIDWPMQMFELLAVLKPEQECIRVLKGSFPRPFVVNLRQATRATRGVLDWERETWKKGVAFPLPIARLAFLLLLLHHCPRQRRRRAGE